MVTGHQVLIIDEVSLVIVFLSEFGPAISWRSKKQNSLGLSTCEAEYMAISQTC